MTHAENARSAALKIRGVAYALTREANALLKPAFPFGACERGDQIGERREVDALAGLDGVDAESGGQVAFARSPGPRK